jgi:hypothetical protein
MSYPVRNKEWPASIRLADRARKQDHLADGEGDANEAGKFFVRAQSGEVEPVCRKIARQTKESRV